MTTLSALYAAQIARDSHEAGHIRQLCPLAASQRGIITAINVEHLSMSSHLRRVKTSKPTAQLDLIALVH